MGEELMKNVYSSIKIFHHKEALDCIERGEIGAPFYIRLKPTNICNHHCVYCTYGSGSTEQKSENRNNIGHMDMIPREKMLEIIEDMVSMGVKAVTFSGGGEPLTYPYIIEVANRMKENGIELSLISNGQLLAGEIAKVFYDARWVRISFDSPDAVEYVKLRGVSVQSFEKVIKNIADFSQKKSDKCVLGINFVISKYNHKRVYEAAKLLKKLGVDNIKFAAVIKNERNYHEAIKDRVIEQIYRAKRDLESDDFRIINNYENDWMDKNFVVHPFPICYTCRLVTVIAADQKIYLCHTRAYDSSGAIADIRGKRFKEAWFSGEVKKRLLDLKPQLECNNFCAYEERNELIQAYFDINYDVL